MVYVFGNSHAHFFSSTHPATRGWGKTDNPYFRTYSLGAVIAYNFFEHHFPEMIQVINEMTFDPNDHILLAIGEVDCRWHLPKQAQLQNRSVKDITHECLDRFFRAHLMLKENEYPIIGWGGHPSTTRGHDENPSEPVFGDCLTRNAISIEWSDYLEYKCQANNIPFISVVKDLINLDGMTKMEYYTDYCHLNPDLYLPVVIEKFKERGWLL